MGIEGSMNEYDMLAKFPVRDKVICTPRSIETGVYVHSS